MRFPSSPSAFTGRDALSPGGQPLVGDDPASTFALPSDPRLSADRFGRFVPAVLRSSDWMRGCSRWRTVRVSFPIESVARASAFAVAAGRRSVACTLVPSSDRPCGTGRCNQPDAHVRSDHDERLRFKSVARAGSCADVLFRAAFRYPPQAVAARPVRPGSFPRRSSGSAPGVLRTLRRFHPACG